MTFRIPKGWGPRAELVVLILFLFCLPCEFARAQTVNGSFHGVVTDSTGAVIPEAAIVIKNVGTGATRTITSDAAGYYTVTQLPPASYTISVSKPGFKTSVKTVELLVAEDREVGIALEIGQVSQQVEVTAQAAAINTTNSTLGTVV